MAKRAALLLLMLATAVPIVSCNGAGAGTLARVKKDKRTYIGAVPFEPPLLYQDRQQLVGPEAELAQRVSDKLGQEVGLSDVEPFWITRTYKTLGPALANEEVDLVVSVYGISDDRKQQLAFSDSYYESELVLVINPVHKEDLTIDNLDGQKIGVREGTVAQQRVEAKYANSTTVPHSTLDDAILALKRGEIDAVVDDHYMAAYALDTTPGVAHLEILPGTVDKVQCAVGVRQSEGKVLELVNQVIAEVKNQSLYAQWLQEHIGERLQRVDARHDERLEKKKRAVQPRQVTIAVARDRGSSFDIYRFANLSFVLTNRSTGQSYPTSRIDFRGSTGYSSVNVPPGNYRVSLPKFNFSPGEVLIRGSDANNVTVRIVLRGDGSVVMTRS